MFGLSLGEIVLLLIVGIVVVGPKNLPTMMRTAGQWVTRLRQMSNDLRSQSGIDDLIRHEGLEKEIQELRSLSRMNVVESLIAPGALQPLTRNPFPVAPPASAPRALEAHPASDRLQPLREREYPLVGCDAGGALADDAVIYHHPPAELTIEAHAAPTDSPTDSPAPEPAPAAEPSEGPGAPAAAINPGPEPRGEASA